MDNALMSVVYELRAHKILEEDIEYICSRVKNRLSEENVNIELQKLGYKKVFDIDDFMYEGVNNFEEIRHKRYLED